MKPENFIYFLTVCGFFIGLFFSVFSGKEALEIFWSSLIVCGIFHIIGIASASFFIKFIDLKTGYNLKREHKEEFLDKMIYFLEKREKYIQDSQYFIENLEKEFLDKKEEGSAVATK